jgi:hypothetical protein
MVLELQVVEALDIARRSRNNWRRGPAMMTRFLRIGWLLALIGCGAEPERSRVVPASGTGRNPPAAAREIGPGAIQKIDMH